MLISSTHFINTIEDQKDIFFIRQESKFGFDIRFYQGRKGNTVLIDVSDGELDADEATGILKELQCEELIPILITAENHTGKGEIAEINIDNVDQFIKD